MKILSFTLALLAAAASPAFATANDDPQQETNLQPIRAEHPDAAPIGGFQAMQLLGLETGLAARDVRLVLTTVAAHEYFLFRADRNMAREFERSLGSERYSDLVAGLPIELHSPAVLAAARNMGLANQSRQGTHGALVAFTP